MLDTLGGFRSENELSQESTVVAKHVPQSITVASILARSVSLEWHEAVAISQSVCAKLLSSGDATGAIQLGADHVAIDSAGDVQVAAVRSGGSSALSQVADLLRLMLSSASVPAPLRLALSQTNATNSLEEWSKSIGYYERPGRELIIQAVYRRAIAVPQPVELGFAPEASPVTLPPPPVVQKPPQPKTAPRSMARVVPALVLIVVVAALAAAAVWFVRARNGGSLAARAADGTPTLESTLNDAMGSLVAQIPGLRETQPVEVDPPPAPPVGRWIHLPNGRLTAIPMSPAPSPPIARSVPLAVSGVNPAVVPNPRPIIGGSLPTVTYSAADAGVVAPVAIYPRFPSRYPPNISDDDFAEFDVIVTETGDVESVRARRVPPTMAEAVRMTMSLSAAKTWRFHPGLKDGEPVRYRQVIRVLKN